MNSTRNTFASILSLFVLSFGCQQQQNRPVPSAANSLDGLGPVHHPVSTDNPDAQRVFDEGLARVYGFNHDAAVAAFKRCAELDPKCAMAYWGQSLAMGPNINLPEIDAQAEKDAYAAARRALELSASASQQDREYILALSTRYSTDPKADLRKHAEEYASAMRELSKKYPDDLDAATLFAESMMNLKPWKLYTADGQPVEGTAEIVATLEGVLKRNPEHIGANHYYIHATEASTTPQRALACAKRLPALAPSQGHLVHMPAHVYIRTGDYAAAMNANRAAIAADDKYISCCHPAPKGIYSLMYYNHNIHFLMVAACFAEKKPEALNAANRVSSSAWAVAKDVPMVEPFCAMPALVMVRFAKWDDILNRPAPDAADASSMPVTTAAWHFARAMALVGKGNLADARMEQGKFETARAALSRMGKDAPPMGNNTTPDVVEVGSHLLAAKVYAASGEKALSIEELKKAVACQDKLTYDEPPPWPWSMREELAMGLMANGDVRGARDVFREDLRRHPNNPRSVRGLAECEASLARQADAR